MFGTVSLPATKFKRLLLSCHFSLEMLPFSFRVPISVFLEKIPRRDALGATIPISLDLWHPPVLLIGQANHDRGT